MEGPPVHFKQWMPVLKRAEELDLESEGDPDLGIVAFYCRKHVVEQASQAIPKPSADRFFMSLFEELEHKKKMLGISQEQGLALCSNHALTSFARAVKQMEVEEAENRVPSKSTALLFYKASTLLDILGQFDVAIDGVDEKRKYAKKMAIEINKKAGSPSATAVSPALAAAAAASAVAAAAPATPAPAALTASAPIPAVQAAVAPPVPPSVRIAAVPQAAPATLLSALSNPHAAVGLQPRSNTTTGVEESRRKIEECSNLLSATDDRMKLMQAQELLEQCLHLRCSNSKVIDAVELCFFALAAKKATSDPLRQEKVARFLAHAKQRLY